MKNIIVFLLLMTPLTGMAEIVRCNSVSIIQVLSGPKYGAMMRISDHGCFGRGGWICLDANAESLTPQISDKVYSMALAFYMSGKKAIVEVDTSKSAPACAGGYPLIEDFRNEVE